MCIHVYAYKHAHMHTHTLSLSLSLSLSFSQTYVPACTQNNFCATSSQVNPPPPLPPPSLALHPPSSQHTQLHPGPSPLPSPFPLARPPLARHHYAPDGLGGRWLDSPLAPGCIRYVYMYASMYTSCIHVCMYVCDTRGESCLSSKKIWEFFLKCWLHKFKKNTFLRSLQGGLGLALS
jgi:hypothetical protein